MTALAMGLSGVVMNPATDRIQNVAAMVVPPQVRRAVVVHACEAVTCFVTLGPRSLESFEHQDMHPDASMAFTVIQMNDAVAGFLVEMRRKQMPPFEIAAAKIATV